MSKKMTERGSPGIKILLSISILLIFAGSLFLNIHKEFTAAAKSDSIVLKNGGELRAKVVDVSADGDAGFGLSAPKEKALFASCKDSLGSSITLGYYEAGIELVFYLETTYTEETYYSNDSSHCIVKALSTDSWLLNWEDWNDNDFDDFIIKVDNWKPAPDWRSDLQAGDILLHRTGGVLAGVLTYTHAGIYVGNGKVAEAYPHGVALYPIENWDYPDDTYVSLYRVNATRAKRDSAASWGKNQTRRAPPPTYDFGWYRRDSAADSPKWYCSELVWASYYHQGVDLAVEGATGPPSADYPVSPDHIASDDNVTRINFHHESNPLPIWPGLLVGADCPVDLTLIDPEGRKASKAAGNLGQAYYLELDTDGDGETEDIIALEDRKLGDYRVKVMPEAGASPDDTYTLNAYLAGERVNLARNVKISDIPDKGYLISAPEKTWYLAEGCTAGDFQTWILVQNPGTEPAHVKLTFMTDAGPKAGPEADLDPGYRASFLANNYVTSYNLSTQVGADSPVIVERAMYGGGGAWGHDSCGVTAPATTWYLAEGSTGAGMSTFILVQNPAGETAQVDITYMTAFDRVPGPHLEIPARSRRTVSVAEVCPDNCDVSTLVTSDKPVVAERAMYGPGFAWGHDSCGVTSPSSTWYLAEGSTGAGMSTFILVQNPGDKAAQVDITYMTASGRVPGPRLDVPPGSRRTVSVAEVCPDNCDVSTLVTSDKPVVAERAMYGPGFAWGHDSCGVTSPSSTWYLAEGATSGGMDTFVLVQNPTGDVVHVNLTLQTDTGEIKPPELQKVAIPAYSRKTFYLNKYHSSFDVSTRITATDGQVICERAMYGGGMRWGHDSCGYKP